MDIVYLDFRKAFDTVPHKRLLTKLKSYGICGNLLCWIQDFLSGHTQKVKINDKSFSSSAILSDIPPKKYSWPSLIYYIY